MSASPYKFLSSYDVKDARLFFGRERETEVLLSDILVARLVVLFAETGTGKTSLINAGVRPRLDERGYKTFLVRVLDNPTDSARAELRSELRSCDRRIKLRGRGLADQLAHLSEDLEQPIVIFFDQFEEFFISTFRDNRAQAEAFIVDIARLYDNEEAGVHIVFSLREDWFVEMDRFRDEIPTIFHNDSNLRLRWFDKKQAGEAIREPAVLAGEKIEPQLIKQIIGDLFVEDRGIEPAQLQIVCDTLWKHHKGAHIRLKDYEALSQSKGKVNIAKQILDQHFESIFSKIKTAKELDLLERLLPLLRTDRNTKYGRDFETLVEDLETTRRSLNPLLNRLEKAQLIRKSRREGLTIIELAHDYLAPRVMDLQERVQAIALRRLLSDAIQRAKETKKALDEESEPGGDIESHYLSPAEFEAIRKGAGVLGTLNSTDAAFLFEAALERGSDLKFWFERARFSGADVWQILEQKIRDPEALIDQAENAVRLLGLLATKDAMKLLEIALQQDALAPRTVDVLGDMNTEAAFGLLMSTVGQGKAVVPILEKLSEMRSANAVNLLESLLQQNPLAETAASALERISRSRVHHVAAQAKRVLQRWQSSVEKKTPPKLKKQEGASYKTKHPTPGTTRAMLGAHGGLGDSDWALLLRRISQGKCTPLLGPGLLEGVQPPSSELAHRWAENFGYPLDDYYDLSRVAQFIATQYDMDFLKRMLADSYSAAGGSAGSKDVDEPHRVLADLPLPVYLTTNYDDFMVNALKRASKTGVSEICRWKKILRDEKSEFDLDYHPSVANPVVYHLWGRLAVADSLVVTEDDHLDFLIANASEQHIVPPVIQAAVAHNSLLFLGYRTDEPDLHVLLRNFFALLQRSFAKSHIAVQLLVLGDQASEDRVRSSREYFEKYYASQDIRVYWGSARDFLTELRQRWKSE